MKLSLSACGLMKNKKIGDGRWEKINNRLWAMGYRRWEIKQGYRRSGVDLDLIRLPSI
jgi:hypothetical protein